MTIQSHYGQWLQTNGGQNVASECCCGEEEACPDDEPQVLLTIFDADYAGGDITWCGETWTNGEVQSGETKPICPTNYKTQKQASNYTAQTTSGNAWFNYQKWTHSVSANNKLRFFHQIYEWYWFSFSSQGQRFSFELEARNANIAGSDRRNAQYGPFSAPNVFAPVTSAGLGVMTVTPTFAPKVANVNDATINSYSITPNFFGTVSAGGIDYTWAQGVGWP